MKCRVDINYNGHIQVDIDEATSRYDARQQAIAIVDNMMADVIRTEMVLDRDPDNDKVTKID